MNIKFLIISIGISIFSYSILNAQYLSEEIDLFNGEFKLPSTLQIPENVKKPPVIMLIAGSGPTDKNGNNSFMTNNHLKYLAEELAAQGIASFRYDKRIIPGKKTPLGVFTASLTSVIHFRI